METGAELENEVVVGARPSLFQFAKLLGDYETAVPAVVDTNTARFFVTNYGKLKETDAPDDPNTHLYNKTTGGGWNQMKYQRIDEKTPRPEIKEAVRGILAEIEKDNAKSQIEKLIGAMRGNSLGVPGINSTKKALKNGQVETLLLDPQSETLDHDTRNELIRLAETTGANVAMVEGSEKFAAMQGVGGLLRYKLENGNSAKNTATSAF